jgi:guanylate kinase
LPPSAEALEARLHSRAQDSHEVIRGRMSRASHEMSHWAEYDYVVVNNDLDEAYSKIESILQVERLRRERQMWLSQYVRSLQRQLEK